MPSALLLGVTQHLATDVVSAPLIWVLPLALYLITFIAAFSTRGFRSAQRWGNVAPAVVLLVLILSLAEVRYPIVLITFAHLAAAQPASYQKRAFPFRVNNLRGPGFFLVNANIVRNFSIGGSRSLQFRLDVQNLLDSVLWQNPDMNPTSTNFGKVTGATNSIMRFFTFVWKVNF